MFRHIKNGRVWPVIEAERKRVHEYLLTLERSDWDQPSLCDGWLIRDVVAHLLIEYRYTFSNSWLALLQSSFRPNAFIRDAAIKKGRESTQHLLDEFAQMITQRSVPKLVSPLNVLSDLLIHEQDIRIALGQPVAMPKDSARMIFSHWQPTNYNIGEKITGLADRVRGLRFIAEDLDLTVGEGAVVKGNAGEILLTITGRSVYIDQLSGEGAEILAKRIRG